jgi:hypothetical protein
MIRTWSGRLLVGCAAMLALAVAGAARPGGQSPSPFVGTLDEHPAIQYETRATTERVSRLKQALAQGSRHLQYDARTGYLLPVLKALDVPVESQLLVFSKTGLQREHTSPRNPRALYFNDSVVVGYIPGAPSLELAAHDPQQGVVFYTLDQSAATAPAFTRRTTCLACHISVVTLEVPGFIDRSNIVGVDGHVMPRLGSHTVNHQTPHTERWGGWFVTGHASMPPYGPLGHLGNMTVTPHPTSGPAIFSNHVLIEWLNRAPDTDKYLASDSDLAALMTFDHQMHALNLLTRLNWEARVAAAGGRPVGTDAALAARVRELVDYLLFVGEAPMAFEVTARPGFGEALAARVPKDRRGRSLAQLDLTTRLLRYPCSYLIYGEAFGGLPPALKEAVYQRMFTVLSGKDRDPKYAHLSSEDRRAIVEILRETKADLPADLRASTATAGQ